MRPVRGEVKVRRTSQLRRQVGLASRTLSASATRPWECGTGIPARPPDGQGVQYGLQKPGCVGQGNLSAHYCQ